MRLPLAGAFALASCFALAPAAAQDAGGAPSASPESPRAADAEAHADPAHAGDALEEIVITASGHVRSRFDVLQSTNVLSGDALGRDARATLGDTLGHLPGIASSGFTAGASRPVIRGMDGPRVRVLQNGVATGDVSTVSADHQVATDPLLVERIEVLRGAGTLRYGSSAIGGVVNVIDGSIPAERPEGRFDAAARGSYDLNADARDVAGAIRGDLGGGFVLALDGLYRRAGNVDIAGSSWTAAQRAATGPAFGSDVRGDVPNSGLEGWSARAGASRVSERGFAGFSYVRNESRYGVPVSEEGEPIDVDLAQNRYDAAGELETALGPFERAGFRFTRSDYTHTELEGDEPGTVFDNDENDLRVELFQAAAGDLDGVVGFQWHGREFAAQGAEALVPPGEWRQIALFVVEEWHADPVGVEAGLRYERTNAEAAGAPSRTFDTWSASLGASFTPVDAVLLGATLSRTERPPAPEELYSDGPHFASASFEVGDPTLDPEVASGLELTGRVRAAHASAGVTFFYTHFDAFVFLRDTGNVVDGLPERVYAPTGARFLGVEIEGDADLAHFGDAVLKLSGSFDWTRAERANGDPLPRVAPLRLRGELALLTPHVDARLGFLWSARQSRTAPGERGTPSYAFVDAGVAWRPLERLPRFSLRLDGNNLLDAKGRNHVSFLKEFAPLPGRSVRLSVALEL
jgi:iron complex outermembrane receptor protein